MNRGTTGDGRSGRQSRPSARVGRLAAAGLAFFVFVGVAFWWWGRSGQDSPTLSIPTVEVSEERVPPAPAVPIGRKDIPVELARSQAQATEQPEAAPATVSAVGAQIDRSNWVRCPSSMEEDFEYVCSVAHARRDPTFTSELTLPRHVWGAVEPLVERTADVFRANEGARLGVLRRIIRARELSGDVRHFPNPPQIEDPEERARVKLAIREYRQQLGADVTVITCGGTLEGVGHKRVWFIDIRDDDDIELSLVMRNIDEQLSSFLTQMSVLLLPYYPQ